MTGRRLGQSEENLDILTERTRVDVDLIKESSRTYCEPNGEIDVEDLETLQEFFAARGLLEYDEMIDVESFIDRSYVEQALESIGRYEAVSGNRQTVRSGYVPVLIYTPIV